MQIVFCVDAVICTMVYSIHEPRKQLILCDCQMKKTEMQASRAGTLTQKQMNTKRKTNSAYEQREVEEDGYKNVKSEGNTERGEKTD